MGMSGYENGFEFSMMPDRLTIPLNTRRPTKYFVNSMSDLFHEKIDLDFLDEIFEVIRKTPRHTYQILTKRENRLKNYFSNREVPDNVWLGVSVESKKHTNRIDILREIVAKIKFLSIEPLLEDIGKVDLSGIDWVIVGGESGFKARPMKKEWAISIKEQCEEQGAAFFFKQWGTWGEDGKKRSKKANGRILEGKEWNEEPVLILT